MILSNEEMKSIQQSLDGLAGLDEELQNRCGDFLHTGKYDEAVRKPSVYR
jgi:hypothetical protein